MISFNANLKKITMALTILLKKTSYDYAVSAIQYEVLNWKKALEANGSFSIKT
jgi:hypothetical protein